MLFAVPTLVGICRSRRWTVELPVFGHCAFAQASFSFALARLHNCASLIFPGFAASARASRLRRPTLSPAPSSWRFAASGLLALKPLSPCHCPPSVPHRSRIDVGCHLPLTNDANSGLSNMALHPAGAELLACTGLLWVAAQRPPLFSASPRSATLRPPRTGECPDVSPTGSGRVRWRQGVLSAARV